jgi:hypothetical protein
MRLFLTFAVAYGTLAGASHALACSPGHRGHIAASVVRDSANYLFKGVPIRTHKVGRDEAITTYKVLTVYKGYDHLKNPTVEVRHPIAPGLCPLDTTKGRETILEPAWEKGRFYANSLSVASFTLNCEFDELMNPTAKCSEEGLRWLTP